MKKMKKTLMAVVILLCVSIVTGFAGGIYKDQPKEPLSSNSIYGSSSSNVENDNSGNAGALFRNSNADGPGGRPDNGDGIGQETPIKDGLPELIGCCLILAVVKYIRRNKKRDKSNL